jgi:hypothetical protein
MTRVAIVTNTPNRAITRGAYPRDRVGETDLRRTTYPEREQARS